MEQMRTKRFWLLLCLGLLALYMICQGISCITVAQQVREATLCADTCYIAESDKDEVALYDFSTNCQVVYYPDEEAKKSIAIYFNDPQYYYASGGCVETEVKPIITIYGLFRKRVWVKHYVIVYDAAGEVDSAWILPVKIDFRLTLSGWDVSNIKSYNFSLVDWGYTDTPIRDLLYEVFGPGK